MWNQKWLKAALALVLASPLLVYPLSWLPKSWAHFRYDCVLPLPEIVLAAVLIFGGAALFRSGHDGDLPVDLHAIVPPLWVGLPVLAVVASAIVSTRFSEHSYFGLGLLPRLCGNVAIFLLAAGAPRDPGGSIGRRWIAVAVLVAANGLVRLKSESEFLSTLGNWDFLGVYLAASLIVSTSIGGTPPFLGGLVLIAAMLFCRSRGAWLALGAVGLLWFIWFGDRSVRRWQAREVVVTLVVLIVSLSARSYIREQWQTDVRPPIWRATISMIGDRPLLGHGLGTYVAVYPRYRLAEYFLRPKATNVTDHAHNELLEVAAEQGLAGLAATIWLWAVVVWSGIRAVRQSQGAERHAALGLMGAMLVLMLHGLVDVDLRFLPNQSLLWVLMGLLVGAGTEQSNVARIAFRSRRLKWCMAVTCLILGIGISALAIIRPIAAGWLDRLARLSEERGDLGATAGYASRSLRLEPFRLSTRYLLAGALARLTDAPSRQMAIDQCLQIEEFAPDYADVTYNLGELYVATNEATQALPYLRRAVEINPYKVDRRLALARALHDTGHSVEAIQQLDCALQLQPDSKPASALRQDILRGHGS